MQRATCAVPDLPRHVPAAGGPIGSAPAALARPKFSQGEVDAAVATGHAVLERRDPKVAIGVAALRAARKHASEAASPARSRAPPAAINSGDAWAIGCASQLGSGTFSLLGAPVC